MASGPVQLQRLPGLAKRSPLVTLHLEEPGPGVVDTSQGSLVPQLMAEVESTAQVGVRFVEAAKAGACVAEVTVRAALAVQVASPASGGQGDPLGGGPVLPVPAPVQEF